MKGLNALFLIMLITTAIALFWNSIPLVKDTVHLFLNPTAGALLAANINLGMLIISGIISLFTTVIQKYTVDNEALRKIKLEQKTIREEMKIHKNDAKKLLELQKKQLEFVPKTLDLSMRSFIFTAIPIILFFRWFSDYFAAINPPIKIFGIFSWFWAYLIFSIIFSIIFRKLFKLP